MNAQEEFEKDANRFVQALKERDAATFFSFFRPDVGLLAVLPMGVFTNYDSYVKSQDHWFKGHTGSFDYKVVRAEQSGDLGTFTVRADYKNVGDDHRPFELDLMITFTFRRIEGKWVKVMSQNSVIKKTVHDDAL